MKKTESLNTEVPITVQVYRGRIVIIRPGILKRSEEVVTIDEIPASGLEFVTDRIGLIQEEETKIVPTRQKKVSEPEKTDKKNFIDAEAKYIGATQLPGNGKIFEVYGKGKSYYLHRGKNKLLISPGISWVKYNRILTSLKKLTLPANLKSIKELLEAEKILKLSGQDFNNWILIALAKENIVVEIQNEEKVVKLKE